MASKKSKKKVDGRSDDAKKISNEKAKEELKKNKKLEESEEEESVTETKITKVKSEDTKPVKKKKEEPIVEDDDEDDEDEDDEEEAEREKAREEKRKLKEAIKLAKKEAKSAKVIATKDPKNEKSAIRDFFSKKYEGDDSGLNFTKNKFYGAIFGELIGSALITLVLMTLGFNWLIYSAIGIIAIYIAVHKMSGAYLNPIVTIGAIATRRLSPIRGVAYLLSQFLGAFIAIAVLNGFRSHMGDMAPELDAVAPVAAGDHSMVLLVEALGAFVIAFMYARAAAYKKSPLTFAFIAGGGLIVATVTCLLISNTFLGLSNNFVLNPAIALVKDIFSSMGETGLDKFLAFASFILVPMAAGAVAMLLSDLADKFNGEKLEVKN